MGDWQARLRLLQHRQLSMSSLSVIGCSMCSNCQQFTSATALPAAIAMLSVAQAGQTFHSKCAFLQRCHAGGQCGIWPAPCPMLSVLGTMGDLLIPVSRSWPRFSWSAAASVMRDPPARGC